MRRKNFEKYDLLRITEEFQSRYPSFHYEERLAIFLGWNGKQRLTIIRRTDGEKWTSGGDLADEAWELMPEPETGGGAHIPPTSSGR